MLRSSSKKLSGGGVGMDDSLCSPSMRLHSDPPPSLGASAHLSSTNRLHLPLYLSSE